MAKAYLNKAPEYLMGGLEIKIETSGITGSRGEAKPTVQMLVGR